MTYYSPNPQSYATKGSTGSRFATDSSKLPVLARASAMLANAKKASAARRDESPFSADHQAAKDKKPSFFSSLLFWQKSKD